MRSLKMIDRSENKIHMKVTSKTRDVPYCDTFYVEEEWYVASMPEGSNSCIVRVSFMPIFVKSTLMKSVISSTSISESKAYWQGWEKMMKDKGHEF